jgi:hypothetical protein
MFRNKSVRLAIWLEKNIANLATNIYYVILDQGQ